jgi:hypothetical protein
MAAAAPPRASPVYAAAVKQSTQAITYTGPRLAIKHIRNRRRRPGKAASASRAQ